MLNTSRITLEEHDIKTDTIKRSRIKELHIIYNRVQLRMWEQLLFYNFIIPFKPREYIMNGIPISISISVG